MLAMNNNCIYCDICYDGDVTGSYKHMCLDCIERILDKSLYKDINPLENYKIKYDKNKITCETCCQQHNLFIDVTLCENHQRCFQDLYKYEDSDYDYDSDCNDYYEENAAKLGEIEKELSQMLKRSKLTYKIYQQKDNRLGNYPPSHIFIYQNDRIVCKFIYYYCRLILILDDKIYTTSSCDDKFREMYFGKLKYSFLEMNEILNKFKNHFNIKYTLVKNFDDDIKPGHLASSLIERFDMLNNPLITYKFNQFECNNCESWLDGVEFFNDSIQKIVITYNDSTLSVWFKNKIYTNNKSGCVHFNHNCDIQYAPFLEIYKFILNYRDNQNNHKLISNNTNNYKEKPKWSDVTKLKL